MDIFTWNVAFLGKYVWVVSTQQESLTLKWINLVYLKDVDWWS